MVHISVEVNKEIWESYKSQVSRKISLRRSVAILVEKAVACGEPITEHYAEEEKLNPFKD